MIVFSMHFSISESNQLDISIVTIRQLTVAKSPHFQALSPLSLSVCLSLSLSVSLSVSLSLSLSLLSPSLPPSPSLLNVHLCLHDHIIWKKCLRACMNV